MDQQIGYKTCCTSLISAVGVADPVWYSDGVLNSRKAAEYIIMNLNLCCFLLVLAAITLDKQEYLIYGPF
jgi:predicted metal-binding transcription factor (methanogenesis marker protein 9)